MKPKPASTIIRVDSVFTLQSIKSRIETLLPQRRKGIYTRFLLYSPLNQGLKPTYTIPLCNRRISVFTLQSIKSRIETFHICQPFYFRIIVFTYSPLNQEDWNLTSRISLYDVGFLFLLYSPLNQGLKPGIVYEPNVKDTDVFTLQSIKSRIETICLGLPWLPSLCFYSTVH